ncbi:hypothetical protein [Mesorhizobium sp. CAU 1732]|uniref:hypothetical protein n=1 Tax=Mesorhizobium sp. CAU 1732 TaxID=3140358 RepID=UPI0032615B60
MTGFVILVQDLIRLRLDFIAGFLADEPIGHSNPDDGGNGGGNEAGFQLLRHALTTLFGPAQSDLRPTDLAMSPKGSMWAALKPPRKSLASS